MTNLIAVVGAVDVDACQRCHKHESLERCGDNCIFVKREFLLSQLQEVMLSTGLSNMLLTYREKEIILTKASRAGRNFQDSLRNIRGIFLEKCTPEIRKAAVKYFEAEDERRKMAAVLFAA